MGNSTPSKSSLHWHFGIGDTTSYVFLRCKYFMYMQDLSINSNLCGREHLCPRNINSGTRTPTICKMRWILTLSIVGKFFSHDYTLCTSSNVLIPRTFLHMLARVTNFETVLFIGNLFVLHRHFLHTVPYYILVEKSLWMCQDSFWIIYGFPTKNNIFETVPFHWSIELLNLFVHFAKTKLLSFCL